MISVAVRISVRVCQRVTICEFVCKSSNTDGAKQQTFQAFNTTTLAYNPSIFTVATTYRENVGSGCISSLIRLVIIIRLRICQRVTSWLVLFLGLVLGYVSEWHHVNLPANHQIQMEQSNKPFKFSMQPHWHTIHAFSPSQQPIGRTLGRVGFPHWLG